MTTPPEDHYRNFPVPITPDEARSGFYVRSLFPVEEFALFLKSRVWCLHDAARYAETFLWSARALQFAPDDPHFAEDAYATAMTAIKHRYRKKYPTRSIPPPERNEEFFFILGEFLTLEERSLFLTIAAHHAEATGGSSVPALRTSKQPDRTSTATTSSAICSDSSANTAIRAAPARSCRRRHRRTRRCPGWLCVFWRAVSRQADRANSDRHIPNS